MKNCIKLCSLVMLCMLCSSYTLAPKDNVVVAVYKGINDDDQFMFVDKKDKTILFDEISDEIEIDLTSEEYIDVTFTITWEEFVPEEEENEEEEEGNIEVEKNQPPIKLKRIIKLKVQE